MRKPHPICDRVPRTLLLSGLGLLAVWLPSCDPKEGQPPTAQAHASLTSAGSPAGAERPHAIAPSRPTRHTFQILQTGGGARGAASVRAAYIRSAQAEADGRHVARPLGRGRVDGDGGDGFAFASTDDRLTATLRPQGVQVGAGPDGTAGRAAFSLRTVGCAGEEARTAQVGAAQPTAHGARVSYRHGDVVEWYQNGRLGIEQGFDIQTAPRCVEGGPRTGIALQVGVTHSLRAALLSDGDGGTALALRDADGQTVLRYSDLSAEDADGKALPARMALSDRGDVVTLTVDDRGARYPLRIDPLIWAPIHGAHKSGDPNVDDGFGFALAVAGDTAVVGAWGDDAGGADAGAAYVFQLDSQGQWTQQVKIVGPTAGAQYGYAVAVSGLPGGDRRIVIGAPGDSGGHGLANWYRGRGDTWVPEAEFSGSGAFGTAVAVAGDRVVIGAPGEAGGDGVARIYEPDVTLAPPWAEAAVIADPTGSGGRLGSAVAIDEGAAAIGDPLFDTAGADDGRVLMYGRLPGGGWTRTQTILAGDGAAGDGFGSAVAVSGPSVAVGAPGRAMKAGGAYLYTSIAGVYSEQAKLHALAGVTLAAGHGFGTAVALVGGQAAVGAPLAGVGGMGQGFLFSRAAGTWSFAGALAPKAGDGGKFGQALSLGVAGHVIVGAPTQSTTANGSGAFYDLILRKSLGDACAAAVDCASDFCVDGVCCDTVCGGGSDADCQACSKAKGASQDGTCAVSPSTFACRPSAGACDQAELCDGTTTVCPADVFQPSTVPCRMAASACDVTEMCPGNGAACPADTIQPAGYACRQPAGDCDVAEKCDGQTTICPPDQLKPSYTVCRLPTSECDQFEVCSGTSAACPTDQSMANGSECSAGSCQSGMCRTEADLGVAVAGPPSLANNQDLLYTVTITNFGRSAATGVRLQVVLPTGARLTSSSSQGGTCQSTQMGVACTVPNLSPWQAINIALSVQPPAGVDTMELQATVSSAVADPRAENNTVSLLQNLLSARISGGGCSVTQPGAATGASPTGLAATMMALLLALPFARGPRSRRRQGASHS